MRHGKTRRLNVKELIGNGKCRSSTDKLFDKIKEIESRNREKADGATLDERMQAAADTKHKTAFKVIKTPIQAEEPQQQKPALQAVKTEPVRTSVTAYHFTQEQEDPAYYVASNSKLASILNYQRILKEFVSMMESVEDQYTYCSSKVSEADRELQDFLHELRMPKRNAYEGFKLYQLGHHLEVKRQGFKNAQEELRPLAGLAAEMKDQVAKMANTIKFLDTIMLSRENKIYIPRSELRLPVGDRFRALSAQEQQEMRQNHEKRRKKAS